MTHRFVRAWFAERRPDKRSAGRASRIGLVVGSGLSFGFIGVVFAIAYESFFSLPGGVLARDYVTLGRRAAESDLFMTVSTIDYPEVASATPEMAWSYGDYYPQQGQVVDVAGIKRRVEFRRVSGNFLSLLGVSPVLGRAVAGGDAEAAVISAKMWHDLFGSDPDVVGEAVGVGAGRSAPIIGVADPAFTGLFGRRMDFWVLEAESPSFEQGLLITSLYLFGVLPADLPFAALQSLLAGHRFPIAEQRNDQLEAVRGLELHPDARRDTRRRLAWLAMVVALLLALAFLGFVDFLAADHAMHEESHAARLAIGATPADVFRDSVAKHAKYGAGIGCVGLASFWYVGDLLVGMEPFASALGELGVASSAIGFGASIVLLAVAFLWSCWAVGRVVLRRSLLYGRTTVPAVRRSRLAWLALLFVAASSLLLTLSMGLRYVAGAASSLGFAHRDVLMVGVWYPRGPTPAGSRRIGDALSTDATVIRAARAEMLPLLADTIEPKNSVQATGYAGLEDVAFYRNHVDAAFFDVLNVDLLSGSFLDEARTQEVVLSRTAAKRFSPEIDGVVGMTIEFAPANQPEHVDIFTVAGVVEDVPYGPPEDPPRPVIYAVLSPADATQRFQDFWLIRHKGDADDIVALLSQIGGGIEEAYRIATPAEILDEQFVKRSVEAVLAMAGAFAFALALAAVLNALVRAVADQARETGIRCALGATEADETRRIAADTFADLLVVGVILCGLVVAGRYYAPALLAIVALPLVGAVLAVLGGVCALGSYLSVRHLARKAAITALAGR